MGQITHRRIDKITLINIYNKFKRQPIKIFTASELCPGSTNIGRSQYLDTLKRMGLIEEVPAYYKTRTNGLRDVKGYKLK